MQTFKIEIQETLSKIVDIEADSIEEALQIAESKYKEEKIILDSSNYVDTDFIELKD
ncbi:MAG: DpnD/PcfM family protein [Endomicrobiaceae bacterium]|nr:DpnD/PcfM family protein [Endomicrobiaceae bacterium]